MRLRLRARRLLSMIGAVRMLKKGLYSFKEIADILDLDPKSVEEISRQITH